MVHCLGSNLAKYVSADNYILLSGNNILYTDTTLVCATSNTSHQIQWQYRPTLSASLTNKSPSFTVDLAGLSVLSIMTSSPGYYRCQVGLRNYDVAIFNLNNTISKFLLSFDTILLITSTLRLLSLRGYWHFVFAGGVLWALNVFLTIVDEYKIINF